MMRGPRNWAVAVRKPDGEIAHVARAIDPLDGAPLGAAAADRPRRRRARREPRDRLPRAERLRELRRRTRRAEGDGEPAEIGRWALAFAFLVAIGFAVMIFKVGPALLTDLLPISSGSWFVLVEGLDPRHASSSST